MQEKYPNYKIFKDVCSGLKYKRKGLQRLLEQVQEGLINKVVVAHRDRLARFATELICWVVKQAGGTIVFLDDDHGSPEQELTEDLMAIVHVFSCRLNGKRRYQNTNSSRKKSSKRAKQGTDKRTAAETEEVVYVSEETSCVKMPSIQA